MKTWTFTFFLFALCVCGLSADVVSAQGKIRQRRSWIIDSFSIEEEHPGPFPYLLGTINLEKKYFVYFTLKGQGCDENPIGVLSIDSKNGNVWVHKKVDYELYQVLQLTFESKKQSDSMTDTRLGVEIKILDINDHAPLFKPPYYEATLDESATQGRVVTTVLVTDGDEPFTNNGTFQIRLVSVTPKTDNVEFYINQIHTTATISFKGCLDYEKAQKYTLLIEAKDNGNVVQLSSTSTVVLNIRDKNNHRPKIIGQTGSAKVLELTSGVEVLRLQVSDKDLAGSPAWKAKFTLHGENKNYFDIQTNPNTNEGVLTVIKAMDYEQQVLRNLSISVENEEPYFSCKVVNRPTGGFTWGVETEASQFIEPELYQVSITVEDVNDPPAFTPPVQNVKIMENTKVGTVINKLKAVDSDKSFTSSFRFVKGKDVENWVTIDPKTGNISVAKLMDRESPSVINSTYSVLVYVVDDAKPPMTGTGTLIIHLGDENDNMPTLAVNILNVCLSENETRTTITAHDLDLPPFSNPFHYQLLGDVKESWSIEPSHGTTVNLMKDKSVFAGHYDLQIKILDNQGFGTVHNLSVTVCDCTLNPKCHVHRSVTTKPSGSAIGVIILAFLLLLAICLMVFLISCKEEKIMISAEDFQYSCPIKSNTEILGSDCKHLLNEKGSSLQQINKPPKASNGISRHDSRRSNRTADQVMLTRADQVFVKNSVSRSSSRRSYRQISSYGLVNTTRKTDVYGYEAEFFLHRILENQLSQCIYRLESPEHELYDYKPQCYASEGEPGPEPGLNLDAISISEIELQPDDLSDLDYKFNKLAAICRPE